MKGKNDTYQPFNKKDYIDRELNLSLGKKLLLYIFIFIFSICLSIITKMNLFSICFLFSSFCKENNENWKQDFAIFIIFFTTPKNKKNKMKTMAYFYNYKQKYIKW